MASRSRPHDYVRRRASAGIESICMYCYLTVMPGENQTIERAEEMHMCAEKQAAIGRTIVGNESNGHHDKRDVLPVAS
jgi:hypothetical protein